MKNKISHERQKLLNSPAYKRRVKNSVQAIRAYLTMQGTKAQKLSAPDIRRMAHFFAEEIVLETKRRDRDGNADRDTRPLTDSVKI